MSSRFQAAWDGDIQKVKQLTTESNTCKNSRSALLLTAIDKERSMDIFTIAVARGHLELAKEILQIVEAQQSEPAIEKSSRKVYEVVIDSDSDAGSYESDSEADESDNEGVRVRFDVIDEQQTIDDVRDSANVGKYTISPSSLLGLHRDMSMFLDEGKADAVKRDHEGLADRTLSQWYQNPKVNRSTSIWFLSFLEIFFY